MTKNKINPELIRIDHIRIIKSNISVSNQYADYPEKPYRIVVQHKQNTASDLENKMIRIRLNTILEGRNKTEDKLGITGEFNIEFHMFVENLPDFIVKEDSQEKISSDLGSTLMGIVYSTARGIILERTQGTYLNGVILPVINPQILIKENQSTQ